MNNFVKISSKENEIIKHISGLQKSTKKRKDEGVFVLEGLRLCMDAVQNGYSPKTVIVSVSAMEKYANDIALFNAEQSFLVPDSLFVKISDTVSPQGILCIYKMPQYDNFLDSTGKYIALENLQDPSNLGAISRTAEALGMSGIILQGGCDPYSSKSLRASMGALLRIPVYQTENMFDLFNKYGLKTFAAVVNGESVKLGEIPFSQGCVALIGNEANGLTAETINASDVLLNIPMSGKAESLNAAVAASIIMWEMCK